MRGVMAGVALAGMMMAGPAMAQRAVPEGVAGFSAPVSMPVPRNNPGEWVSSDDYPSGPIMRGEQGVAAFVLTVDSAGRVDACQLTQSTGSVDLDAATCRLVAERALFEPAKDAKGRPVPSLYRNRIRWQLPPPTPNLPDSAGSTMLSFIVQPDGSVMDCQFELVGAPPRDFPDLKAGQCPPGLAFDVGYLDKDGRPVARRVVMRSSLEVLPIDDPVTPLPKSAAPQAGRKP